YLTTNHNFPAMIVRNKIFPVFLFLSFSTNLLAQLKPGDVHPNAKVLDVDELFPFSDGVARIRKGPSTALIESSGNFVVPFNKWDILKDSKSGLLVVSERKATGTKYGLINTEGK